MAVMTALRLLVAVVGGYALTTAVAALAAVLLPQFTALPRDEAVLLAAMSAFVLYAAILLWALLEPCLARVSWLTLGGAGLAQWMAWRLAGG